MIFLRLIMITSLLAISGTLNAEPKESVDLFIYFDKPPFIVDLTKKVGMSYDFANALNQFSTKYAFNVTYLPKKRALDLLASDGGALLWTNPSWVEDTGKTKYEWISALFLDSELYITNDVNLKYQDISSLYDKTVVGVRGYYYFDLEESFSQKYISRIDVKREIYVPDMLMKKRGDVGVIGLQTYWFLVRNHPEISEQTYIMKGYDKEFYRSILVSKLSKGVKQEITNWLASDTGSRQWTEIKSKWLH